MKTTIHGRATIQKIPIMKTQEDEVHISSTSVTCVSLRAFEQALQLATDRSPGTTLTELSQALPLATIKSPDDAPVVIVTSEVKSARMIGYERVRLNSHV